MYAIERGIEIPPKPPKRNVKPRNIKGKQGALEYYPWSKMKVGDYFIVKDRESYNCSVNKKYPKRKYAMRTLNYKDTMVIRVK